MGWVRTCPGSACPVAVAAWRSTRREKLPARGCAATPVRSLAATPSHSCGWPGGRPRVCA
eukprot:6084145-Alexandrium_andersonii.AAC.1